jgi:lactate permease
MRELPALPRPVVAGACVRVCVCVCAWSAAIFLYDMCVVTGHFETVKFTIVSLSSDKRLLALLLAWCFSSFIDGESQTCAVVAASA